MDPTPKHHPPITPPLPVDTADITGFVPACPDCRYELSGLPDGRCPECGLTFTRRGLEQLWLARHAVRGRLSRKLMNLALVVAMFGPVCLVPAEHIWVAGAALAWYTALLAIWLHLNRERWIAYSHRLLFFLLPLMMVLPMLAATPIGIYASMLIASVSGVVCWLALRWSPLVSGVALLAVLVLPATGFGALMVMLAAEDIAAGRYWSSLDKPTPFGWMAMPAPLARQAGVLIIGVAIVIGAIITVYARRALVRLKARSKPVPSAQA